MKLERFLVYVRIVPRPGDELEQRTLLESAMFEVPIFGELLIEAKGAAFVDREQRLIQRPELLNRLWKYFGEIGRQIADGSSVTDAEAEAAVDDPLAYSLDGFWIRVTGIVTSVEGQGLFWNAPMGRGHLPQIPQFTVQTADGIGSPIVHVLAELIEFEADPMRVR